MSDFPLLLASEMGVTRRTVIRWCTAGKVPGAYRTKGGHWQLRKPRRIQRCSTRYDDKILEFVVSYTSVPGSPLSARQATLLNKITRWIAENKLLAIATSILDRLIRRPNDNTPPSIDWQSAEETERLIDSENFNNALEFSLIAAGISEDDIQQHFVALKDRDPEKYRLLTERDLAKVMHPRADEATATRSKLLIIKAAKLRLNMCEVTPQNLAHELRISLATLYRRYGKNAVHRACRAAPACDELPTSIRYQLN